MSYNRKALSKAKLDLDKYKKPNPYKKDILYTQEGQWKYPGQKTRIPSSDITMQGVPFPVFAQPNVGQPQMMYPGQEYSFPGASYVDEYPQMKKGGLVQMPKPSKKGLASKKYSRSLFATNKLFTENPLFKKPKSKKRKVFDPNAKYYQDGGITLPNDYIKFKAFTETLPSNLQDPNFEYGNPDQYNLYGMWETVGKPNSFAEVQDSEYFPLQDDGTYYGFTVGSDGEFLKPMSHGTTWKEVMNAHLNTDPYFQQNRIIKNEKGRLQYIPNNEDDYIELDLSPEEIEQYAKGGYVVEELPEMQPGGPFKPGTGYKMPALSKSEIAAVKKEVSKAKPVAAKLTGTVGKSTSSSKAPVKKTFGVTPSGKKVITTVSTKTDEIANKAKEDAAYEKFLDQNLGKEGSNTYTYVDPITGKTEQREYSNAHLKDKGNIAVDEATWNANRDRQNMQHLSEAISGVGEITGINSAIRTGERLIDDPLKFADDLTTGISQAPETLVEGAMTLGSKLFGDNKDYVDVDTDALGVALDVAGALPVFGVAGKAAKPVLKTGLKYADDVIYPTRVYRASVANKNLKNLDYGLSGDAEKIAYEKQLVDKINKKGDFYTKDLEELSQYLSGNESRKGVFMGDDMIIDEVKVPFWKKNILSDKDVVALKQSQGAVLPGQPRTLFQSEINSNEFIIPNKSIFYPRKSTLIKGMPQEISTRPVYIKNYKGDVINISDDFSPSTPFTHDDAAYSNQAYKYLEDQINAATGQNIPLYNPNPLQEHTLLKNYVKSQKLQNRKEGGYINKMSKEGLKNNYIDINVTEDDIIKYVDGGYIVEELPDPSIPSLNQYAPGGAAEQKIIFSPKEGGCPKGEYWTGTECKKIPPNTKIVYSKKEYDRLTKLNKLQNQIYKDALSVEKYLRDINSRYHDNNLSHIEYYLQRPVNKSELRKWKSVSTLPKGWENQSIEYLPGSIMQSAYGANPWHTNQRTYVQDYFKKLRRANMTPKQWFYTNTDSTIDSKEPYVNHAVGMYPVFDKPSQKNYILGYKKEEQPINDFGYMAGTLAEELKAEQRMLEELQPLRPDLIKQDLGLPAVDAVYEDEIQPPTYTPTGDNYIINDYYISPSARKMQRKTNYNSDYYYDHYDDDGNLVLGETTKADQENRRINFKGASTKKDLKAQKEYNKAYDEYEKLMEQKELEKKFIESQIGMYKYLSNKKEGGLSSFKKGGLNSPKDLDPVTLEKYLSDLRGLENSIKKGYKNNKWYPHSSIEGGANTIAYGHKLQPGESFSSGLTEQQARDLQKKDVLAHQTKAEKFVDDKYGKGTYDKLPQNSQMLLTDYAYNLGSLNKFPSFVEGVVKGDKNKMLQQYERRGLNERNKWTKDVINTTDFSKDSDYGFNWMFDLDGWWNKQDGGPIDNSKYNSESYKKYQEYQQEYDRKIQELENAKKQNPELEAKYTAMQQKLKAEQSRVDKVRSNVIPTAKRIDAADDKIVSKYFDEQDDGYYIKENTPVYNYYAAENPTELKKAIANLPQDVKNVLPGKGQYNIAKWEGNEWNSELNPNRELYCTPYGCFAYQEAGASDVPTIAGNVAFADKANKGDIPFEKINAKDRQPGDIGLLVENAPVDYSRPELGERRRPHHTAIYATPGENVNNPEEGNFYNAYDGSRFQFGQDYFNTDKSKDDRIDYYRYVGQTPKLKKQLSELEKQRNVQSENIKKIKSEIPAPYLPTLAANKIINNNTAPLEFPLMIESKGQSNKKSKKQNTTSYPNIFANYNFGGSIELKIKNDKDLKRLIDQGYIIEEL